MILWDLDLPLTIKGAITALATKNNLYYNEPKLMCTDHLLAVASVLCLTTHFSTASDRPATDGYQTVTDVPIPLVNASLDKEGMPISTGPEAIPLLSVNS